ncbi:MAG: EamA family transporter [Anaerolineae bacterium]|nr:EamA family transporter [Anaerolineae bacterium]
MRPEIFALITAIAWGVGGFFEKRGLALGNLTPQVGITIRTAVALVILGAVSFPQWKTIPEAGPKALLLMVIGGGVIAGSVGMLSFYSALRGASSLAQVMPIAFTSPLFSALTGLIFGAERLTWQTALGMVLTIAGIAVLTTAPSH